MLTDKKIINIAEEAYKEFPHKIEKPKFSVLTKDKFIELLFYSPLIRKRKNDVKMTPSLTVFRNSYNEVCFCPEIIKNISEDPRFAKALALHELYHIWNRLMVSNDEEAINSENIVFYELAKDFPELAKLLEI